MDSLGRRVILSETKNKKLDDQNQMIFKKISLTRKIVPGLRSESTNIFCD